MEGVDNIAMDLTSTIAASGEEDLELSINLSIIENPQQPASYMKLGIDMDMDDLISQEEEPSEAMAGQAMLMAFLNMEVYEMEDYTYSKSFLSGDGWLKAETTAETTDTDNLSVSQDTAVLGSQDTVIAGLTLEEDPDAGTITLKGSVYIEDLADQSLSFNTSEIDEAVVGDYYLVYVLDRDTYEVISLTVDVEITGPDENGVMTTITSTTFLTMDVLDEDYKLTVPDEVLDNIVEFSFGF